MLSEGDFFGYTTLIENAVYNHLQYRDYKILIGQSGDKEIDFIIHPYYLKQFNNRWFLFGLNDQYKTISNLALDRIIDFEPFLIELQKAENRLTSHGYLEGLPGIDQQLFDKKSEQPSQLFIGLVKEYDDQTQIATIEQRNYFEVGYDIEIFHPSGTEDSFILKEMTDEDGEALDVARHPKQILKIKVPFHVEPYAMLRRK